jgi:hypothetical protein
LEFEFRCFQSVEEIRQRPSSNGAARTAKKEHLALEHRTKRLQHLRSAGRGSFQHLQGDAERQTGTNPLVRSAVRARHFASASGLVEGEPMPVYASHEMVMPAYLPGTGPVATADQIILVLGDSGAIFG